MNLAIIQPVADLLSGRSPYRDEVAMLGAALRHRGHQVTLTLLDRCDEAFLSATVAYAKPDLVLLYVEPLVADLAVRIAGALGAAHGGPLVPFGPHAALRPDECLSLTGAEAVATGPADVAIPAYVASRLASLDYLRTPGMWVKCETGVMRNPPPPPPPPPAIADMAAPARDLYPFEMIVDAAGFIPVTVSRGGEGGMASPSAGPQAPAPRPGGASWPVLHRPVGAVLDEMLQVADEHFDLRGFRIGNERWLARPEWVGEFADRYRRQMSWPIRTRLYAPDITAEAAALLARAGCEEARIPIGSGSALIRNDVLGLAASDAAVEAAFATLRHAGVRTVACIEVGAPYETPASVDQTVEFLRRLDPDGVQAVLHYPMPGSTSERIAQENGWLVPDPAAAYRAGRPAVALPRLAPDDLVTLCEALPYVVLRPRIAPLIRLARRVRIGRLGTLYELALRPLLVPPTRRKR
jgi:radical SAM superfamily enzyme YgiQ (UPF0313 family)